MVRSLALTMFLAMAVCSSAYGQAGAGECAGVLNGGTSCSGSSANSSGRGMEKGPSTNPAAAAKFNQIQTNLQNNLQIINNVGDAILDVINSRHKNNGGTDNSDAGSADDSAYPAQDNTPPAALPTSEPSPGVDATAAISELLDSNPSATSTATAVSALLSDGSASPSSQQASAPTASASAVANLLDNSIVSDSSSAFAGYTTLQAPADPEFNAAMQDSTDRPNQSLAANLTQMLQAPITTGQQVKDELSGLVSSTKGLISSYASSPAVQWLASQGWNGTTAPLPAETDSQETATDLTFGQATVGLGDILEGMANGHEGIAHGIYNYGSKMVDQMGAFLGLATNTILEKGREQRQ